MQTSVSCISRPSKKKQAANRWPLEPMDFQLVAMLYYYKTDQCFSGEYCRQIADKAMKKLFRAVRKKYPNMVEDLDLHWTGTQRGTVRHRTKKQADTDVVGGGGKDAPVVED